MKKYINIMVLALVVLFGACQSFADEITLWTTETQPDRLLVQEKIAEGFTEKTGNTVKVIPVEEKDMHTRVAAAFAASDLPDVIYHPLPNLLPWADAGILNVDAADDIVRELDTSTFAAGLLEMANMDDTYVSVPVDGGSQILVYRKDIFDANGLEEPTSYANIEAAIKKLHNPPEMYGFVVPTKVDESYMMQVIEHLCLADGYSPVNADGTINENTAKLKEVLKLYKSLFDASPKGELYWKQSREQYLAGKAAMILWSGAILDELGGLRDSNPVTIDGDPTSKALAKKSGFITALSGPDNPKGAAYVFGRYFGITTDANEKVASEFVLYMLNNKYKELLSMCAENKVPVRSGTLEDKDKFYKMWATLPIGVDRKAAMADMYSQEVIDRVRDGLEVGEKWGAKDGQLTTASNIINSRIMSQVFRKYADGELTLDQAADQIVKKLKALL